MAKRINLSGEVKKTKRVEAEEETQTVSTPTRFQKIGNTVMKQFTANTVWLIFLWSSFVIVTGRVLGDWWWDRVFSMTGVIMTAVWILAGSGTPNSAIPFRYKLSKFMIWFTGLATLIILFIGEDVVSKAKAWNIPGPTSSTESLSVNNVVSVSDLSPEETRVKQFWYSSGLPKYQADAMIEHARKESGFRQFNPDGSLNKNPNSTAIGVMQVMESAHKDEADKLGFKLNEEEGNLNYALHLVKQRVAKGERFNLDWDATADRPSTVVAPIEGWTEAINVPPNHHINWVSPGNLWVRTQDGTVKDGNESFDKIRLITVEFQSSTTGPNGTPEAVEVEYFFSRILR